MQLFQWAIIAVGLAVLAFAVSWGGQAAEARVLKDTEGGEQHDWRFATGITSMGLGLLASAILIGIPLYVDDHGM